MNDVYVADGTKSFSQICREVNCPSSQIVAENSHIRELLLSSLANNGNLPAGVVIFRPYSGLSSNNISLNPSSGESNTGGFSDNPQMQVNYLKVLKEYYNTTGGHDGEPPMNTPSFSETGGHYGTPNSDTTSYRNTGGQSGTPASHFIAYRGTGGYYGYGDDGTVRLWKDYFKNLKAYYEGSGGNYGEVGSHTNHYRNTGGNYGKIGSHTNHYRNTGGYYGYGDDGTVHMWYGHHPTIPKPEIPGSYAIYAGNDQITAGVLPVLPQEFSDTNSTEFDPVPMLGRSVNYQIYNGSSREVSFVLNLHSELGDVKQVVKDFQAATYPLYRKGLPAPPEVLVKIGEIFKVRGILTNCSASWKTPIVDGEYSLCDLSLGIKETTGPYGMDQIRRAGGFRQ